MSDKMIAEGQGPELDEMLQTLMPMKRLGRAEEIADAVKGWVATTLSGERARAPRCYVYGRYHVGPHLMIVSPHQGDFHRINRDPVHTGLPSL